LQRKFYYCKLKISARVLIFKKMWVSRLKRKMRKYANQFSYSFSIFSDWLNDFFRLTQIFSDFFLLIFLLFLETKINDFFYSCAKKKNIYACVFLHVHPNFWQPANWKEEKESNYVNFFLLFLTLRKKRKV
jgi:hypothetical protein